MWRGGRHVCVSTKLEEKRKAKAVEQALMLTGSAENGTGARLDVGRSKRDGADKEFVLGLLGAVYGDVGEGASVERLWDEYLEVMRVKGKEIESKTMRDKKSCFDRFLAWARERGIKNIVQVDGNAAQGYALGLVGMCSAKRRRNILAHLSSVWNAVLPNHRGAVNPWAVVIPVVKPEKERVGFTREEEARVLKAAKEVHEQWYVASMIARHTGLRYGDVCRLEWGQVDFKRGVISVRPHKTEESSGVEVVVPMAGALREVLEDWKRRWEPDRVKDDGMARGENGRFVRSSTARPSETDGDSRTRNETHSGRTLKEEQDMVTKGDGRTRSCLEAGKTASVLQQGKWTATRRVGALATDRVLPWLREYGPKDERRFSTVLKRAGLDPERYSFHSWRHLIASRLGEAGVGIETRKRILGHTTNEMARHYDHSQHLDEMRAAVEAAAI